MAGDWIKMRVWLSRDPRVIRMADYLAGQRAFMDWLTDPVRKSCEQTAYEHVTRNVTVALCVTSLLVTWGTAREQGDRDGDDLVLKHAGLGTVDAMTDLPCFGAAMAAVEWVVEDGSGALRFPKFFKENESPEDRHKRQAADRQARFREKQSRSGNEEVTQERNVTVTHREEKRREEEKTSAGAPVDWIPADTWQSFVAHRKAKRAKLTPRAVELLVAKLDAYRKQGVDPQTVLDFAIESGHTGLYYRADARAAQATNNGAGQAWKTLRAAIVAGKPGDWSPAAKAALDAIGGWAWAKHAESKSLDFKQREFEAAYNAAGH